MSNIPLKDTFTIEDLETLKVISDPLRLRLLEEITQASSNSAFRTAGQLAKALGTSLHKLYYHLNLLEKHGLIRVAETRLVSGIVEKHYAATAWKTAIAADLLNRPAATADRIKPAALSLFDTSVQNTRSNLAELLAAVGTDNEHTARLSGRRGHMTHDQVVLTQGQAEAFHARLLALTEEFSSMKSEPDIEGGTTYTLLTVMIPTLPDRSKTGR